MISNYVRVSPPSYLINMNIQNRHYRSIWLDEKDPSVVRVLDQRHLPFNLIIHELHTVDDAEYAIREMIVRGAPLIGATAAYGMYLATLQGEEGLNEDRQIIEAAELLKKARPTAVNLAWAIDRQLEALSTATTLSEKRRITLETATGIANDDVEHCRLIGKHGLQVIEDIARRKNGAPVNILTHCNAGWLACVDYGTATAPMYLAHDKGIPLHIWVDETRPRNQGARLTAFELGEHGIPHTIIPDNTGGHLMQHKQVDLVIVGCDRATATGDVCNKIGTYLKALAAHDNGIPFYVALPSSTFDWTLRDGITDIPIEERNSEEVEYMHGLLDDGTLSTIRITPPASPVANYGFDVTPARLVTGLITERGICPATEEGIQRLFPEQVAA